MRGGCTDSSLFQAQNGSEMDNTRDELKTNDGARERQGLVPREQPEEFGSLCGGKGGVPYCIFALPPSRIISVSVWHREYVDGIRVETEAGALPTIGGTGKHRDIKLDSFRLDPDEFITGISAEYWTYLDRIAFHTNKRTLGPWGGAGGRVTKKILAPTNRRVVGFKGRHWELVDSIQLMVF